MDEPLAYRNGELIAASSLAVSPTDAGFVLGATVADQLRTFAGKLFRLDEHLARLEYSLEVIGVAPAPGRRHLADAAEELVAHNHRLLDPGDDLGLSLFATPGRYQAYSTWGSPTPNLCMHTYPLPFRLWADKYQQGQVLVTTEVQQVSSRCWPPELKCRSRMHYYLADRQAARIQAGARALLLDAEGWVSEASTANVVIYRREEGLVAPPRSRVFPGISLAVVGELAARLGIPSVERDIRVEEVASADEVMLTSTPLCLVPVTRFNGQPVSDGKPGPVFQRILDAWSRLVGLDIAAQAERFADRDQPAHQESG
jgi:branched-subunit amino acid aminotransferase/4-amino-4-deoxychorismate lyase